MGVFATFIGENATDDGEEGAGEGGLIREDWIFTGLGIGFGDLTETVLTGWGFTGFTRGVITVVFCSSFNLDNKRVFGDSC
jgi:hypothetical protein